MRKLLAVLVMVSMVLSLFTLPAFAVTPVGTSNEMYAQEVTTGDPNTAVQMPVSSMPRIDPEHALYEFDAELGASGISDYFYAVNSHAWSNFTFGYDFWNIDNEADLLFREVTWNNWHAEAALVYLTDAYVKNDDGDIIAYAEDDCSTDNIINGYLAGVVWNKTGITELTDEERDLVAQNYLPGGVTRNFENNVYRFESSDYGWTEFHLPDAVVHATGVTLVDITEDVYNMASSVGTYNNNTDGYDLDAIRAYKYEPWRFNDTATGCDNEEDGTGDKILTKGTWFMYNEVNFAVTDEVELTFPIQAGNPKDGVNIIGEYTVTNNGDGTYTVDYEIDDTIEMNGYIYDISVISEHLGISDTMSFTAKPGQDDNQDFGVEFDDVDGVFYIFAHFAVEYR